MGSVAAGAVVGFFAGVVLTVHHYVSTGRVEPVHQEVDDAD